MGYYHKVLYDGTLAEKPAPQRGHGGGGLGMVAMRQKRSWSSVGMNTKFGRAQGGAGAGRSTRAV